MTIIQVIGSRPGAGKTCLIAALSLLLTESGQRVSYYKPFSANPANDPDPAFISQRFMQPDAAQPPNPQPLADGGLSPLLGQEINDAVGGLKETCDVVLVEGPDLINNDGLSSVLAGELASLLECPTLLMVQYSKEMDADRVSSFSQVLGDRLNGLIINGFPVHRRREIAGELVGALRDRGLLCWGAIPDDRAMLSVTVQQVSDHLAGRWIGDPVNTDAPVDRFLIGGNIMDSGPNYFGRHQNQAVITRAERPDIQMASLLGDTKCLVLTGGGEPIEYVRVEARNQEVPMISVEQDTLGTAESLSGLLEQANCRSVDKARRFARLMKEHLDLANLDSLDEGV